jgi:hypothetical protein
MGAGHGVLGLLDLVVPAVASPIDRSVVAAMDATPYLLASLLGSANSVWEGSVGWNTSHGLGIAYPGLLILGILASPEPHRTAALRVVVPRAVVFALLYTGLAWLFWFSLPMAGFAIAALVLYAGWRRWRREGGELPGEAAPGRAWLVAGILPLLVAGVLHAGATAGDIVGHGFFSPVDDEVRRRMAGAAIALPTYLGADRDAWTAYLGFNVSHGLGLTWYGVVTWHLVRRVPSLFAVSAFLRWLPTVMAACWLAVAALFFFWLPLAACVVAVACLARFSLSGTRPEA